MKEIVYATTNQSKIKMLQEILGTNFKILSLKDVGVELQADEKGLTVAENSLLKARFCFKETGKPCFAMDYGFYIEGLAEDDQPKQKVKGLVLKSIGHEPSDDEALDFYINLVKKLGGKVNAHWDRVISFVSEGGEFSSESKIPKILADVPSKKRLIGFPMTSIQIDQKFNKYESELTEEESGIAKKETNETIRKFVFECLNLKK